MHAGIDWSRPHTFLDTELQQIVRDAEIGVRRADRLVRVWLPDGEERGCRSISRSRASTNRASPNACSCTSIASSMIMTMKWSAWRSWPTNALAGVPDSYQSGRWGSSVRYNFLVAKLTYWRDRRAELETSDNPFATVVLAHLAAQETRGDATSRERAKLHLIRRLTKPDTAGSACSACCGSLTGSWRCHRRWSDEFARPSRQSRRNIRCHTSPATSAWRARKALREGVRRVVSKMREDIRRVVRAYAPPAPLEGRLRSRR